MLRSRAYYDIIDLAYGVPAFLVSNFYTGGINLDTKVFYIDEDNLDINIIKEATSVIRSGGTVVIPTETVYGLGANALSSEAVSRIFKAKGRPSDNPLIVHISCLDMLIYIIGEPISPKAQALMDRFWPGPLTLIFKKSSKVPREVTAGLETVAVRMPDSSFALSLIEESGLPIAAPSANLSGKPSPTMPEHVVNDMAGRVDMIICGKDSRVGVESTVLDLSGDIPTILRPGGVTYEQLREVIGEVAIDPGLVDKDGVPKAPGMKYTHYAPEAEMLIVKGHVKAVADKLAQLAKEAMEANKRVGILSSDETKIIYSSLFDSEQIKIISLGSRESSSTMAARMFAALREFDKAGVDVIYAEAVEEVHIGMAVMNRMKKAAGFNILEV